MQNDYLSNCWLWGYKEWGEETCCFSHGEGVGQEQLWAGALFEWWGWRTIAFLSMMVIVRTGNNNSSAIAIGQQFTPGSRCNFLYPMDTIGQDLEWHQRYVFREIFLLKSRSLCKEDPIQLNREFSEIFFTRELHPDIKKCSLRQLHSWLLVASFPY